MSIQKATLYIATSQVVICSAVTKADFDSELIIPEPVAIAATCL